MPGPIRAGEGIAWWDVQRKGANCQSTNVDATYWQAAATAGIEFVRLVPDGWKGEGRDFLLGNADRFEALPEPDVATLRRVLDDAHAAGVRVVLTMFSLPGARWKQNNGDRDDARLWHDARYHAQAETFWQQLAARLRDHPAIAGYDPLNEPHPERGFGFEAPTDTDFIAWSDSAAGTPADLEAFNRGIVAAIRRVDPTTPIFLEGGFHANAEGLARLHPLDDAAVVYSFHFYEPWSYTTFRANRQDPRIWDAESRGEDVEHRKKRRDNPLWRMLAREFTPLH